MITLYHGSNVRIAEIDLQQCNPYKDFGQAFYLTTDPAQAMEVALYASNIYAALQRPTSGLYSQSSGYVYALLEEELSKKGKS